MRKLWWLAIGLSAVGAVAQVGIVQDLNWDCVRPSYVIAGDFNGDGWDDFAVACHSCNMILVGLNPRSPRCAGVCPVAWPAPMVFKLDDSPTALAWGLFGSGVGPYEKRLVAVTQYLPAWTSFRVTDTRVGMSVLPVFTANHVIVGDFNENGALDVAVLDPVSLKIHFPLGGIPTINLEGQAAASQPAFLATADFDRDGDLDLVVASGTDLLFYENTCRGEFVHRLSLKAGIALRGLATADFDNDGRLDLVAVDPVFGAMVAIRNMGCWSFDVTSRVKLGKQPVFVVGIDLNRDGKVDFAVAEHGGDLVSLVVNRGRGEFRLERSILVGRRPASLAVGDFDRNGISDLVVALSGGGPNGTGPAVQVIYNPLCTPDDCTDKAPCCIPGVPLIRHGP